MGSNKALASSLMNLWQQLVRHDVIARLQLLPRPKKRRKGSSINVGTWPKDHQDLFFFFLKKVFFSKKQTHSFETLWCKSTIQIFKFFFFKKRESVETQDYIFSILDTKIGKEKAVLLQLFFMFKSFKFVSEFFFFRCI